jgi:hypothetical protein
MAPREIPGLYRALTVPLWSQTLYDLLVSERSIRYFLRRTWGSEHIDEDLARYDYLTTHQPGAKHAPYAFVAGRLFSRDIRAIYERLTVPVWMPHATRGDFGDVSEAGWTQSRPTWLLQPFPAGALVHFECLDSFMESYQRFLEGAPGRPEEPAAYGSSSEPRSPSP